MFDFCKSGKALPHGLRCGDRRKAGQSPSRPRAIARLCRAAFLAWLGFTLASCASKQPQGVADVPECRQAADGIVPGHGESNLDFLRRQADAYSDCMTAHGYALDEERLTEQLTHIRDVQASDWMRGDPWELIAVRRQQLRLSASMWRPADSTGSEK